jgi:predicted nucleic acid-binding protein
VTRYLLDTDVLVDFSKGIKPVISQLLAWIDSTDVVAVCAISVAEFSAGLTPEQAAQAQAFLTALTYWDISREAAMRAGQERYSFARSGVTITTTDALLAAVAREYEATLVTSNLKDFPMADLTLLSIRQGK